MANIRFLSSFLNQNLCNYLLTKAYKLVSFDRIYFPGGELGLGLGLIKLKRKVNTGQIFKILPYITSLLKVIKGDGNSKGRVC